MIQKNSPSLMMRRLPIANVGKFKSMTGKWVDFTEEDLKETAEVNNKLISEGRDQPLVLLHVPNDVALVNDQVYGHVSQYYTEDKTLFCDIEVAHGKEKQVLSGAKRMVSLARFPKSKEIYHIAYTGRQAIPIANTKFASFEQFSAEFQDEIEAVVLEQELEQFEEEDTSMEGKELQSILETFANKDGIKQEDLEKFQADLAAKVTAQLEDLKAAHKAEIDALSAKLEGEKAEAEKRALDAEKERIKSENKIAIEKFSDEGNMLPAQMKIAEDIFSCEDITKIPALFSDFLKLNKVVDFNENYRVEDLKLQDGDKEELSAEEIAAISDITRLTV